MNDATVLVRDPAPLAIRRVRGHRLLKAARSQPLGAVGLALILMLVFAAAAAPLISPYDPNEVSIDVLQRPSRDHWFGTDNFGRDYFSRILAGARVSITVALAAITAGVFAGSFIGMVSAYLGGVFDLVFQRLVDTMLALPFLVVAMLFVAVFGSSVINLIVVLALALTPGISRVARGSAVAVLAEPYIEAARVVGVSAPRLLVRYVLPNIAAPVLVILTTGVGTVILAEAGLSFLGLGIAPPQAEWGQMLSLSRTYALQAPWLAIFPGAAISLAVLGFNLFGDAIRDLWDPRLRTL
jgi:peptide/nickel transport system permease protein